MAGEKKYLFGPVASRRLGLSLGVDIIPLKTCTQNCIYCQLGVDGVVTLDRKPFVPIDEVIAELKQRIEGGLRADFITISGSGEPTLNSQMGLLIERIKKITKIPIVVITNGTLLTDPAVRADCAKADVVLPSLDAGDEATFRKINRAHKDISFTGLVDGLCRFREEYAGLIWLEVFLCEGINTSREQIEKIRGIVRRISPDKVHLNTAVRPVVDASAICLQREKLEAIASELGQNAEVIADFPQAGAAEDEQVNEQEILAMLSRRPCSLDDICSGMGGNRAVVIKILARLSKKGAITSQNRGGKLFYWSK